MIDIDAELRAAAQLQPRLTHYDLEPRYDHAPLTTDDFLVQAEKWLPQDWCLSVQAIPREGRLYFLAVAWLEGTDINLHSDWRKRPDEALEVLFFQLRDL